MSSPIAKLEILTIKVLAEHLKSNERTIYLPASADIDAWISSQSAVSVPKAQ